MSTMQDIARALLKLKKADRLSYHRMMYELNRAITHETLIANAGNRTKAAEELGLTRTTISKYIDIPDMEWKEKFLKG